MAKDVTFTHPDYDNALPDWTLTSDAAAGERAVKSKTDLYLPRPNASDTSPENVQRYASYIKRAVYYNVTGRTLQALAGLAFNKWPQIEKPSVLDSFDADATGSGVSLIQLSQEALQSVLKNGRCGVLVDFPQVEGEISLAQQQSGQFQPTISLYSADSITNWQTSKIGSQVFLTLVVLKETHETTEGFELQQETQYRVLRLVEDPKLGRVYTQEVWRKKASKRRKSSANDNTEWVIVEGPYRPRQGNGKFWTEIPFTFIGSRTNDSSIDPAPMLDIAILNIAHYRNSADFEESVYMLGQPQAWMGGLDQAWVEMLKKEGIYFGSRHILPLPQGGSAGLLQMNENTAVGKAMEAKEKQMAALGARLVMPGSVQKTAYQQGSEDQTSHSVLSLCCDNVSLAFRRVLEWAANFANAGDAKVEFSISTDFMAHLVDAHMLTAMVGAVQAGTLPLADFWAKLRSAGIIADDRTDDQLREEIDTQAPPTMGLDDDETTQEEPAAEGEVA